MDSQELRERVEAFPTWHYEFDLGDVTTPVNEKQKVNRHIQRKRIGFDPLVRVAGGSLRGKRVLDLGCNAGYWSLAAIEADADLVFGIDGRQMHVDQANLVFEAKGIDPARYRFECGNIFEYDFSRDFDVVLCLGLMYHISKPVELFEVISRVNASLVLIDTIVNLIPVSAFRVVRERVDVPLNAVDYETVLIPSRQAVLDIAKQFGFDGAVVAQHITDYTGMKDYKARSRAAIICAKGISLDGLERERADRLTLGLALARKAVRRAVRHSRRALGV
jgi:2-polyprenyl-3-methyl-5-hydroxy-6-metoxy-1,4-benzoquinol methylase